jgi:hypothetical protein
MQMHIETITLEVAVQASAADTENLRGAQAIAVTHLQNLLDVVLAHFVKRKRTPVGIARQLRSPMLQMFREIADVDEIAGRGDARRGNYIFELANVSRPRMLKQDGLRAAGQTGNARRADVFEVSARMKDQCQSETEVASGV